MKFKHKITGETVTLTHGDRDNVWYKRDGSNKVILLQAEVFFNQYESVRDPKKEKK